MKGKEKAPNGYFLAVEAMNFLGITRSKWDIIRHNLTPYQITGVGRKYYKITDVQKLLQPTNKKVTKL